MTAETSNARGEWPERYACNGPEGTFWTDDADLANKMIGAAFDRDEWTVTDTQNPTGAAPSSTAETSNARGELRMTDIREDAREPLQLLREKLVRDEDGWAALCELMPMLAAAPPPAAAEPKTLPVPTRVYLTDKAAVIVGDPQCGWDEEGPDAHNCDAMGCASIGPHVLARVPFTDERAMSQQPEAQGVVDEGIRIVTSQLLHWGGIPVRVTGTVTTSPGNWPLIDAAQRQEPKS